MKVLLIYGGFILFGVVIITLAVLTTKYAQKHNPYGWYMWGEEMTVEQFHKIRTEYGIYSFQIPTKEMLERITEEDLRETFSNFKKLVDKMKGKKQSKE